MAQQTIGLGTTANDGTGDNLRAAGAKINANFAELYTGIGAEAIQDIVGGFLVAGQNVTLTYDDAGNTLTIAAGTKNNYAATTIPGPANDNTQGYAAGSTWLRTDTGGEWRCISAATGAAVWIKKSFFPGYVSGQYYRAMVGTVATGAAMAANIIRLHPCVLHERVQIAGGQVRITTAGTNLQAAAYAHDPATGLPTGNALGSCASVDVSGAAGLKTFNFGASFWAGPGLIWLGINVDNAATAAQNLGAGTSFMGFVAGGASASMNSSASNAVLTKAVNQTYGTWPDLTAASFTDNTSTPWALVDFKAA